jgi:meso-butanediol dehydrogenase / (S,S)-butanediol dehydrogenase / diacetyl reductase
MPQATDEFAGKAGLVTGAGAGIGREVALELARRGADIGFLTRTPDHAAATRDAIEALGRRAVARVGDVGDPRFVEQAVGAIAAALGGLDIVVPNAGIEVAGTVVDTSVEDWHRILATNVSGVFYTCKWTVPHLVARGGGAVVVMGSDGALTASQGYAAYITTKHALVGLTRCLALDHGPQGVRATIVCPGFVETDMMRRVLADHPAQKDFYLSRMPLGRFAQASEVADVVCHLAGPAGAFTSGSVYSIDGGLTAGFFEAPSQPDGSAAG